jgi:hypothetical protein
MTSPINQDPPAAIAFAPAPVPASSYDSTSTSGPALADPDQPTATITPATATAPRGRIIDDSARGTIFWEADPLAGAADEESGGGGGDGSGNLGGSANSDEESPYPVLPGAGAAWGKPFRVEWESTRRVPFFRTRGMKNAWNAGREVKIARDGTEIETKVGRRLIALFGGREGGPDGSK